MGRPPSGKPEAELWFGAHPACPSRIVDPNTFDGSQTLLEAITKNPEAILGSSLKRFPYLMKILAAAKPLSLQVHPSSSQAQKGFEKENFLELDNADPRRNYKDPFHKPEMILALEDYFDALCGFRKVTQTLELFDQLLVHASEAHRTAIKDFLNQFHGQDESDLRHITVWALSGSSTVDVLIKAIVETTQTLPSDRQGNPLEVFCDTANMLNANFPDDPGIIIALLLNRVLLAAGEALFLPAGNFHSYLSGIGIELMADSDNVIRGGLTEKRIDIPELLHLMETKPLVPHLFVPHQISERTKFFHPPVEDFALLHIRSAADHAEHIKLSGPTIVLVTEGTVTLETKMFKDVKLNAAESVLITPDEETMMFKGRATLFAATPNTLFL